MKKKLSSFFFDLFLRRKVEKCCIMNVGGFFMYLIYGESYRLIEDEISKIKKEETNVITIDLSISTLDDVLREATYVSMFQEKKFLIVRNAFFFTNTKTKEENLEPFFKYIENPIPLTTIIFTSYEKVDARKKIYKEFAKKNKVISVSNLSNNDLMAKSRDFCFRNKFKIDNETLQYILNCCGNNYDLIYNELNKVFLYYGKPQKIELEDVKEIVSKILVDNNFKFVEAVVLKNATLALKLLEDLYTLKVDPIALLMLLAREYRLMFSMSTMMSNGFRKNEIAKDLGLQDWQIDKILKESVFYYKDDLKEILKKLSIIDYKIKSGNGDRFLEFKTFLLDVFS